MSISEKKLCSGYWTVFFLLIFLEPASFIDFYITDTIYQIANAALFLVVFVFFFRLYDVGVIKRNNWKTARVTCLLLIYYVYLILITVLNNGRAESCLMQMIRFGGLCMYTDMILKNNPKILFKTELNILIIYITIDFLSCCFFPNGIYSTEHFDNNFFLGYDNQNINFIFPALVLVLLKHQYIKKCKAQIVYVYVIALLTVFKVWSAMSMIMVTCMSLCALFFLKREKGSFATRILNWKIFRLSHLIVFNLISNFSLVVLSIQTHIEFYLYTVLHKTASLSGRTVIWERNIARIKRNPIFGYGKEKITEHALNLGFHANDIAGLHAHNRILETLYTGGLILFSIYMYILFYTANCLKSIQKTFWAKILSIGIFLYLMGMLTEQYEYCPFFWVFLVMAENGKNVLEQRSR